MATMAPAERFDMGRVIARAGGALGRNIGLFAMLGILLVFIPSIVQSVLTAGARGGSPLALLPITLLSVIVSLACTYLMQAAVTHVAVRDLQGEATSFGGALGHGAAMILPLIGLAIIVGIGVMIGFMLLIVPGVILAIMWTVAVPVLVEERPGVFASLSRSSELTKGSRWSIFLMFLAFVVFAMLIFGFGAVAGGVFNNPAALAAAANGASGLGGLQIVMALLNTVLFVAVAAFVAAIYVELRFIREGAGGRSLSEIFA